jgi:hypothetical protein
MPFLTITTVPNDPPLWDKTQLGCQSAIAKSGTKLAATAHKNLVKCLDGVLKAAAGGGVYTDITAQCTAALDPADPRSKVGKAIAKLQASLTSKCGTLLPADLATPCSPTATTFADVATCLVNTHLAQTGAAVAAEYGTACALISAVGLDTEYAALCAD